jgi:GNAT superfamily N-acetyltransferase
MRCRDATPAERREVAVAIEVIDALEAGRHRDAVALVFEYMATTFAETGPSAPVVIDDLPVPLRRECENLPAVYAPPGTLLVAYSGDQPAGCVGLASHQTGSTAEIKRLYVRPAHRRQGLGRLLMGHAHCHAAQNGFARLVLDVLSRRAFVISLYHRLGYTETGTWTTSSEVSMVGMQRFITNLDTVWVSQ